MFAGWKKGKRNRCPGYTTASRLMNTKPLCLSHLEIDRWKLLWYIYFPLAWIFILYFNHPHSHNFLMVHLTLRAEPPNLLSDAKWSSERMNSSAAERVHGQSLSFIQWRIQGPGPPIIFSPNRDPKGRKNFFWRPAPPSPLSKGLDDLNPPPLISRSESGIVIYHPNSYNTSPMLSLFAVVAGQRQGGINWNTLYFSKYINSHDSFYWQIFHEPLTLDIFMHIKSTFLRLRPVQKNISWVFLHLGDNYY